MREPIARARAERRFADLLERATWALERHRFALDLHRDAIDAVDAMGHARARAAHEAELRAFIARMPACLELTHADGSPFASEATRAWLGARREESAPAAPRSDAARASTLHEAAEARAGARGLRERFERTLELATLASQSAAHDVALALFDELAADAARRALDAWEPALVSSLLVAQHRALVAARPPELRAAVAALVRRLALVDPLAAAAIPRPG